MICSKCKAADFKKLTEGYVFGLPQKYKTLISLEDWQLDNPSQDNSPIKFLICNKCITKHRFSEFRVMLIMVAFGAGLIFLGEKLLPREYEWVSWIGFILCLGLLDGVRLLVKKDIIFADIVATNLIIDLLPNNSTEKYEVRKKLHSRASQD